MQTVQFFRRLLGLNSPWLVHRVTVAPEKKQIDVLLTHRRPVPFPCPECGAELPVYDHTASRSWRHLDTGGFLTFLHARVPRVRCLFHGTRQVLVPWALEHARCTLPFEGWAIDVLRETDVLGATRLLRISWDEAWGIMERAVIRGRRVKQQHVIAHLGVDEKAVAKGHCYFTVVNDLDRGTVEYVVEDRKQESLEQYYQSLSSEQLAGIKAVAMDMWDPYIAATKIHVPEAGEKMVFDRYHVMRYMLKAVDEVRKAEHRALLAQGNRILVGTKYLWLFSEENLPEALEEWLAALRGLHLKTGRAWAIKESLRDLWDYQRRGWAERHWRQWYFWATHSRLPPVIAAAKTMQRHLPNILTYFAHRITNAASEGVNSKIETLKKTPVGSAIGIISRWPFTFTVGASICTHLGCRAEGKATIGEKITPSQGWQHGRLYHIFDHRKPGRASL
jgi:transposase